MRQRNLILGGAAAVVVVGAAGWFMFGGGSGGATALPGDGGYQTQLSECQERVWGDQMHLAELEFTPNTVWHQDKPDVKLGGKFTMPGQRGMKTPFTYECTFRAGRLLTAQVQ